MSRNVPIVTVIVLAATVGCGAPAPETEPKSAPIVHSYTVRGEVTAVDAANDGTRVYVRHEAIPDFRVGDEVVGMDSMTMPFALAANVSADAIEVGTPIEFDWAVDDEHPAGRIVRLDVLPSGTAFSWDTEPEPPASEPGHDDHGS